MAWEIFHDGKEPYPDLSVAQVAYTVRVEDYRMPFRGGVNTNFSGYIAAQVWNKDQNIRPTMAGVVQELGRIFNSPLRPPK